MADMQSKSDDYIIEIRHPTQEVEPEKRHECCIYKVPQKLRDVKSDAYTPKLISIGPFHHPNENLKMEELKYRYFWNACARTKKSKEDLVGCIKQIGYQKILHCYAGDQKILHYYAEDDPKKEVEFMKMILLDSIFIIEQLWRTIENQPMSPPTTTISPKCEWRMWDACVKTCQKERKEDGPERENPKENHDKENPWRSYNILQDLILLENQVPFFVLEKLYNFAYRDLPMNQKNGNNSFLWLVHKYFLHFWGRSRLILSSDYGKIFCGKEVEVKHFTDFLRYFLLPKNRKCGPSFDRVPCATKLSEAGVEFKVISKSETGHLLDIQFQKGGLLKICPFLNLSWFLSCFPCFPRFKCLESMQAVFELKSFIIGDATECAVRNLMALEQCHYPREAYICNYIILLDNLINTEADVDLLVEKNVIVNWLGDNKAVATLINKLCEQIVEANHSCYWDLSQRIKKHYDSGWSKVMASFTTLYFKDFWRGTATVVGIMVLFFSFWNFLKPFVFPT